MRCEYSACMLGRGCFSAFAVGAPPQFIRVDESINYALDLSYTFTC